MKLLLYSIMIFGCLSLGSVCCKKMCDYEYPVLGLRIANKADSSNLLFGNKKLYNFSRSMFFNKTVPDSFFDKNIYFSHRYLPNQTIDTFLYIHVSTEFNKIYFQLPNNSLDSFEFSLQKIEEKNCDAFYRVAQLKFNNTLVNWDTNNFYLYTIYK